MSIEHSSVLGHPIQTVFDWHARPGAFQRLSPPWQPVRVEVEARSLADGRAVVRLPGGIKWVAQHRECDPPHRFVDDLVSLPLRWHHVHSFEAEGPDRTRVTDSVTTPVPEALLRTMFAYRHTQLRDDLAVQAGLRKRDPQSRIVAVTGSSGLVGTALCAFLSTAGHRVIRLVRRPALADDERSWDPDNPVPDLFVDVDAVVHLAGASIAGRFSRSHMQAIAASRIGPTRRLAEAMANARGPRVLLAASAIGYYGSERGDDVLEERAANGHGFLADVVTRWEAATEPAAAAGIRVVKLRTGVALTARGGLLELLRPVFLAGLGGRVGNGRQWLSWIDLDDLTDIYARALVDEDLDGPVNAVAPRPVRNEELAAALSRVLHRPAVLPVPRAALRVIVGTAGVDEVACASQRVAPARLDAAGFSFRRPSIDACLRHQLGHPESVKEHSSLS